MAKIYPSIPLGYYDGVKENRPRVFAALRDGLDDGWEVHQCPGRIVTGFPPPDYGADDDTMDWWAHDQRALALSGNPVEEFPPDPPPPPPRRQRQDLSSPDARARVDARLAAYVEDEWSVVVGDEGWGAPHGAPHQLLLAPGRPAVYLEASGHRYRHHGGRWFSISESGSVHLAVDPFALADDHRGSVAALVNASCGRADAPIPVVCGLVLPEADIDEMALPAHLASRAVIDRAHFDRIDDAVDRLLANAQIPAASGPPPTADEIAHLRDVFAPRITATAAIRTGADLGVREIALTREQSAVLDTLGTSIGMVICGPAGSGKTETALAHARRQARRLRNVVYVCAAGERREALLTAERPRTLDIHTLYSLARHVIAESPYAMPPPPALELWEWHLTDELPALMHAACDEYGHLYDDIIVDDANWFTAGQLRAIRRTARHWDTAHSWQIADSDLSASGVDAMIGNPPRPLLTGRHRGVVGPPGTSGGAEVITTHDQPATVGELVRHLHENDGIPLDDLVVLTGGRLTASHVAARPPDGYAYGTWMFGPPAVQISSIPSFVGLSARAAVLCELDHLDDEVLDMHLHAGVTRARERCYVVRTPRNAAAPPPAPPAPPLPFRPDPPLTTIELIAWSNPSSPQSRERPHTTRMLLGQLGLLHAPDRNMQTTAVDRWLATTRPLPELLVDLRRHGFLDADTERELHRRHSRR